VDTISKSKLVTRRIRLNNRGGNGHGVAKVEAKG
jgi:hypothetical protein